MGDVRVGIVCGRTLKSFAQFKITSCLRILTLRLYFSFKFKTWYVLRKYLQLFLAKRKVFKNVFEVF